MARQEPPMDDEESYQAPSGIGNQRSAGDDRARPRGAPSQKALLWLGLVFGVLVVYVFLSAARKPDPATTGSINEDTLEEATDVDQAASSGYRNFDPGLVEGLEVTRGRQGGGSRISVAEQDQKHLDLLAAEVKRIEQENKEALEELRKAKLARIQADFTIYQAPETAFVEDKANADPQATKQAIGNIFGGQYTPEAQRTMESLAARQAAGSPAGSMLDAAAARQEAVSGLGGRVDPDQAVRDSHQRRDSFNKSAGSVIGSVDASSFVVSNSPTVSVHSPIPITIGQEIDTRTPGTIQAFVTQDVYDETGVFKVIPAGTKLIGRANGEMDYGNPRVQLVWDRLTFSPDYCNAVFKKSSCHLSVGGVTHDKQSKVGVQGRYNQRILSSLGYATLFSVIGVAPAWLIDQIDADDAETGDIAGGGGGNVIVGGSQQNTDTRDLYEDLAQDAYGKVTEQTDRMYERLSRRGPYAVLPSGLKALVYLAEDVRFPEGAYQNLSNGAVPWIE